MNPDDLVLVALLNHPRDLELVERERWYRIPRCHAPRYFEGAQYLAFYLASAFGDRKWTIPEYAAVRGHELVRRSDLLPDEPDHPRANDLYYKLQLGPLEKREPPITSKRGRRVLFLWTNWQKFSTAHELNDLFAAGPAQERLWEALRSTDLDIERQAIVREGHSRYRVDFLIYCPRGRLGITIGGALPAVHPHKRFRTLDLTEQELEAHFERVLERIERQAREMGHHYPRQEAQA
ncbi:MAG: hypothetical protein WCF84_15570 [Anaerolineae bacterium]